MKTIEFKGKDASDLKEQQWNWQSANKVIIITQHPIEQLPLNMKHPISGAKMQAQDAVLMRIDYTD